MLLPLQAFLAKLLVALAPKSRISALRLWTVRLIWLSNTPFGQETRGDGYQLRTMCVRQNLCYVTTLAGAQAFVSAIENLREQNLPVIALQDLEQWEER